MKTKFTLMTLLSCFLLTSAFAQQSKTMDVSNLSPFEQRVEAKKNGKTDADGAKQVEGALIANSGYAADATIEIPFVLDLTNEDGEWVDSLAITFPAGMTPVAVSNDDFFVALNSPDWDDEAFNGISGQTVSWGDNDNSWGGIPAPDSWPFTVTVTVDAGVTGDQTVSYFASGDEFGAAPGDLSGDVTLSEGLSVYGIVVNSPDHTVLEAAINTAGLAGALAGGVDPVTLFAPTDAAFTDLLTELGITAEDLLGNPDLADILLYHALGLSAPSSGLTDGQVVETLLEGESVTIGVVADPFAVSVNGENVSTPDLAASNGIVHVIDGVLLPPVPVVVPLDFELGASAYSIIGFGGAQNTSVIPNPDPSGINTSENVWQQTQDAANQAETFAGAVVDLSEPVDFATNGGTIQMDVWTPQAVTDVTLRFEVANNTPAADGMELTVQTTETSTWETLTFDFSGNANIENDFVRVVVFFNLGATNTDDTFYADNIRFLPTIYGIVEASPDHTTLETALIAAGFDGGALNNPAGDFTLFAPTDDAFAGVDADALQALLDDPNGALANVLLYHVVGGTNLSGDLSDGLEVLTAQGETVTVGIDGDGTVTINGAEVTLADIPASNGVVHVIDAVLLPGTCTQFAGGPYTNFVTAFGGVPVEEDGVCPYNVITGFQSWASEAYQAFGATEGVTYEFGLSGGAIGAYEVSHVITDNATGAVVASADGNSITWTAPADGDYLWIIQETGLCGNQSENTAEDNGFPYMTCVSSSTITDIVVASPDHETLEAAVIAAGLDATLAGEGPFTVFAPTDEAFDALPAGLLDDLLADPSGLLTDVLTHHVVGAIAYSTDLSDGQVIPTLNGEDVTIGIDGDVTVTSALGSVAVVTVTDIIASNGVVHVIDAVLAPTILSIDNLNTVEKLNVYPNPANNQFTVDIELNEADRVTVDFINVVGQVVKSVDFGNRSVGLNREYIDINDLSEGIYFMNLTVGDDQATVKVQVAR